MSRFLYLLLGVVSLAAAVLSFDALRQLALLCGFSPWLAWLLPVVVDAGAAAGSLVWLGGRAGARARCFARRLAMVLLGLSVAANAISHLIAIYSPGRPPWWVVAAASGIAPAVLWASVHLVVLWRAEDRAEVSLSKRQTDTAASPAGVEVSRSRRPDLESLGVDAQSHAGIADVSPAGVAECGEVVAESPPAAGDRAAELIAAGYGWRRLGRALELDEYEAKKLIKARRNGSG